MKSIELIINPNAGHGDGARSGPDIARALTAAGMDCVARLTNGPGHAGELAANAARNGVDYIAIAGGDGSINEVVNGLMNSGGHTPLAVMPVGTGNDFVKMLTTPTWQETVRHLQEGRTRQVDVGRCNDKWFANGIGVGFDAKVARIANATRWLSGNSVYVAGVLRALLFHHDNPEMRITMDGTSSLQRVAMLSAANGQVYGGSFRVAPDAKIDDGFLDVVIAGDLSRGEMLAYMPKVMRGAHILHPNVSTHRTRKLVIESSQPLPVHADGEMLEDDLHRLEIEVHAGKLNLVN